MATITCTATFRLRWSYELKQVQNGTDDYNNPTYETRWYSREYIDNVSANVSHDIKLIGFNVNGTIQSAGLIWETYNYGPVYPYEVFNVQAVFRNAKGQNYYSNTISRGNYGLNYTDQEGTYTVTSQVHL